MISGSRPSETMDPRKLTAEDRRKPVLDRSIRYHRSGLAIARVSETCIVDAHGIFRCVAVSSPSQQGKEREGLTGRRGSYAQ